MTDCLPIEQVLPALVNALRERDAVVLSAAPGAGKTTRVPLALLEAGVIPGRIIMLEPRRLAAQRAAQYMAAQRGETVGASVGYRIRGDSRVSAATRIEVVTEGILTHLIQRDPELNGVGLIIFDEFHERSLHADLGLALVRDVQKHWRDDLKVLVMSATLDGVAIAALLGDAPVIESAGRQYPVDMVYLGSEERFTVEQQVAQAVVRAVREQQGDVLVFLPGRREIQHTHDLLQNSDGMELIRLHVLFGEGMPAQQQAALQRDPGGARKVILSTSIAETSLTIDGVRVVVDAGLVRTVRFDPRRAMSGLVTVPVSQATATQRAGRAGRQAPGVCYRLWSESRHTTLARFPAPEMLHSDLMPLALELAVWGTTEHELAFVDPPPAAHLQQARSVLKKLGALDDEWRITVHGRAMADLPVHPRYAHMLLRACDHGFGALACDVAALLEERDLLRGPGRDVDFHERWRALQQGGAVDRSARERVRQQSMRLRHMMSLSSSVDGDFHEEKLGLMLALCYPERVARRRDARGERWQLASGTGASLRAGSVLASQEWIAIADIDGEGRDARILLAATLDARNLREFLPELFFEGEEILWSPQEEAVIARDVSRFGAIVFAEKPLPARGEQAVRELCRGLKSLGWSAMPVPAAAQQFIARLRWLTTSGLVEYFPDFSEDGLLNALEQWLAPFLSQISRRSQLGQVDWLTALQSRLDYSQLRQLDQLAPVMITVPTGSRIALDYTGAQPVLAVRLQEMFGLRDTPLIGDVPVLIHLLSPARQPLAVTKDLASFWQNAYQQVRKDMRGQYPKHYWPENPLDATPTTRTKAADDRARKKK